MTRLFLAIILCTWMGIKYYPKDISGKWQVERVDVSEFDNHITAQQKTMIIGYFKSSMTKAVFNFRADHQFLLTTNLKNMPQGNNWAYNSQKGVISILNNKDKSTIMLISVTQKADTTFFAMQESPIVLKMHKLSR